MAVCHGQGNQTADPYEGGCCHLPGVGICPHRWFLDWSPDGSDADVWIRDDSQPTGRRLVGSLVNDIIPSILNGTPRRARALDQVTGRFYACSILAELIGDNGNLISGANWASDLNTAWSAEFDTGAAAADVGDLWIAFGHPRNYCPLYAETGESCCFGEDAATNAARLANLSTAAVAVAERDLGA